MSRDVGSLCVGRRLHAMTPSLITHITTTLHYTHTHLGDIDLGSYRRFDLTCNIMYYISAETGTRGKDGRTTDHGALRGLGRGLTKPPFPPATHASWPRASLPLLPPDREGKGNKKTEGEKRGLGFRSFCCVCFCLKAKELTTPARASSRGQSLQYTLTVQPS